MWQKKSSKSFSSKFDHSFKERERERERILWLNILYLFIYFHFDKILHQKKNRLHFRSKNTKSSPRNLTH